MKKNNFFVLIIGLVFIIGIFYFLSTIHSKKSLDEENYTGLIKINNMPINIQIAQTDSQHHQGLSGRKSLPLQAGMLFVFNDYKKRNFVMREMNFPLDFIWIKDDYVVSCSQNVPVLDKNQQIKHISSPDLVNYVLEVNAGFCYKNNIKAGDRVDFN